MGYIRHKIELDKDTYDRYKQMTMTELYDIVEQIADKTFYRPCAYGLSAIRLYEENERHILSYETQDSCD